tara:strand:+ start:213 stop:518 length:306 start_codon:yes stop_codon:yes gene_type:complete
MPGHYGGSERGAMERQKNKSVERRIMNGGKKKKPMKVFEKKPPNSHMMPDGTIMSGKTHNKDSKPLGRLKASKKPSAKSTGKGSKAMKEKMARLRAMRKKK